LFDRYAKGSSGNSSRGGADRAELRRQICQALLLHTRLEEDLFYPACRRQADAAEALNEAQVEHDSATVLIAALLSARDDDDQWADAQVKVLAEQVRHHIGEES
ncbi:hemerythrin domain-containing protein, partial [Mycobacterium tuberculosis]